jgi:hypothetical protein
MLYIYHFQSLLHGSATVIFNRDPPNPSLGSPWAGSEDENPTRVLARSRYTYCLGLASIFTVSSLRIIVLEP